MLHYIAFFRFRNHYYFKEHDLCDTAFSLHAWAQWEWSNQGNRCCYFLSLLCVWSLQTLLDIHNIHERRLKNSRSFPSLWTQPILLPLSWAVLENLFCDCLQLSSCGRHTTCTLWKHTPSVVTFTVRKSESGPVSDPVNKVGEDRARQFCELPSRQWHMVTAAFTVFLITPHEDTCEKGLPDLLQKVSRMMG